MHDAYPSRLCLATALTCLIILLSRIPVDAQAPASPSQLKSCSVQTHTFEPEPQLNSFTRPVLPPPPPIARKTANFNPIPVGSATNLFSILNPAQNQIFYDSALDLIGFIHRQDVNIWGGTSGQYRVDLSSDGGVNWDIGLGPLTPTVTSGRYPNIAHYNPTDDTDQSDDRIFFAGAFVNGSDWDGHVLGQSTTIPPALTATDDLKYLNQETYLPGGMCEGRSGEFWYASSHWDDGVNEYTGKATLYKGTYDSQSDAINWAIHQEFTPQHSTSANDGYAIVIDPSIAFSPDGNTAWMAWIGDLDNGTDSVLSPIFIKSTDGGQTWGTPFEISPNVEPWVADSLTAFWQTTDSMGNPVPAGRGRATFSGDFDLTVDINGNPHFGGIIFNATSFNNPVPSYGIYFGLEKFYADLYSPDGGATWQMDYISPVLTFETTITGSGGNVGIRNFPQIARNETGDYLFYSWIDSDTNSTTGVGFGTATNDLPNLRVASKRVTDGYRTCVRRVTDSDIIWNGAILGAPMGPIVSDSAFAGTCDTARILRPHIVSAELTSGDPFQAVRFYYISQALRFDSEDDYLPVTSLDLSWNNNNVCLNICNAVATDPLEQQLLGQPFPNPTAATMVIPFHLDAAESVRMEIRDVQGRLLSIATEDNYPAGSHELQVDLTDQADGVYFVRLITPQHTQSQFFVVQH